MNADNFFAFRGCTDSCSRFQVYGTWYADEFISRFDLYLGTTSTVFFPDRVFVDACFG